MADLDAVDLPLTPNGLPLTDVMASLKSNHHQTPDSSTPDAAPTQDHVQGSQCAIQTLYEGPPKCNCCKNWVKEYPDDLGMSVEEQPRTKEKALVVRMGKNHGHGKPLALVSVVMQSSCLKDTLCELFEGCRGITASLKRVVFTSPFRPFHDRWERFFKILER